MVHKRGVSLLLRTLHLVSFGILLGGHTFAIDADRLPALYLHYSILQGRIVQIGEGLSIASSREDARHTTSPSSVE